ncbi:hypothetical protein [Streptomyces sp. RFCAC02]|uniref:hypothetical protein n=1 Tax=Streptomyces sp. RFCAC02 TaxID=2499143 RepID=UPI00101FE111|nr:hypothetical protein [Streptomyces sp. RFCAC02]
MSDRHPGPEELADLEEDLLPTAEAAALHDHLTHCTACSDTLADLALLRQELQAFPAAPIPDDIAARIEDALGAVSRETRREVPRETRGAVPRETRRAVPRGTEKEGPREFGEGNPADGRTAEAESEEWGPVASPTGPGSGSRRRRPRLALAAAGALVMLGFGAIVVQSMDHVGTGTEDAGTAEMYADGEAADGADQVAVQVRELLAEAAVLPSVLSTSGTASPDPSEERSAESAEPTETEAPDSAEASPDMGSGTSPGPDETGVAEPAEVPSCVEAAIGRREAPLAAGEEDYAGNDAYLVVFAHSADPDRVDAYMVDAGCVNAHPPISGEVLLRASYPRE